MPNFLEGKVTLLAAALFILVSCSFPVPRKEMKPSATPVETPALPTGEAILSTPETEQDIQPSPEDEVALWKEYNNPYFKVNLRYPADWEHQDGEPSYGERFGNQQGFFTITAMGGPGLTLDQAAQSEAQHKLQPYGPNPLIEILDIHGQEARLIIPGGDELDNMRWQAGLIVRYPTPLWLNGNEYPYLVVYSDPAHIQQLAQTIQFDPISNP